MFDRETAHFIRCDGCPDHGVNRSPSARNKDEAARAARRAGWSIRDDLHLCPRCLHAGMGLALAEHTAAAMDRVEKAAQP